MYLPTKGSGGSLYFLHSGRFRSVSSTVLGCIYCSEWETVRHIYTSRDDRNCRIPSLEQLRHNLKFPSSYLKFTKHKLSINQTQPTEILNFIVNDIFA